MKKTGVGIALTDEARAKLDTISDHVQRSRSGVVENLIMNLSDSRMLYYARKKPVYADREDVTDNEADGATTGTEA